MWCGGWIQFPINAFLSKPLSALFTIPFVNVLLKLPFALTKFVPMSLIIVSGLPCLATNLMNALRELSESNFGAPSIWTALTDKHMNRQQEGFTIRQPIFTINGLK